MLATRLLPRLTLPTLTSPIRNMTTSHPTPNTTLTATFTVQPSDLASALSPNPNDNYARVLATPRVIGFMEIVAARMLIPHMSPGQMSVGVRVDMMHLAATPVDEEVSVTATFLRKDGKAFIFDVVARDVGGEIGKARHERAIVDEERLMSGARKRVEGKGKL